MDCMRIEMPLFQKDMLVPLTSTGKFDKWIQMDTNGGCSIAMSLCLILGE